MNGFQSQLRTGYIRLAQNRLPVSTPIEDLSPERVSSTQLMAWI
jgi:hypothetical protein